MSSWSSAPAGRREVAERGDEHGDERQADAGDDALERDAPGAAGDHDRLAEPVEPIDREHDVGRLGRGSRAAGADCDAHIGERERGRIVDAVADHDRVGPDRCLERTASTLSAGLRSASTSSTPITAPTVCASSSRSPVTITMRRIPSRAQLADRACGVGRGSGRRSTNAPTGAPSTSTNTVSAPSRSAAPAHGSHPAGLSRTPRPSRPCRRRRGGRRPDHARPGRRSLRRRSGSVSSRSTLVGRHARPPPRARGATPDRAKPRDAAPRRPAGRPAPRSRRPSARPAVIVPVLSNSRISRCGEPLERRTALDDDASARRAREPGDDRDRCGQDQRARRRDHQHGDRPHELARRLPTPRLATPGSRPGRPRHSGRRGARTARSTPRRPRPAARCRRRCSRPPRSSPAGRTVRRR